MHGVSVCHVLSPEKQESGDVHEQLFLIFLLPRNAEHPQVSPAKQGWNRPFSGGEGSCSGSQAKVVRG